VPLTYVNIGDTKKKIYIYPIAGPDGGEEKGKIKKKGKCGSTLGTWRTGYVVYYMDPP